MDSPLHTVTLEHAGTRVVVLPELGGKIAQLTMGGRSWLWRNERMPFARPTPGAGYVETADSGGFDECFPTVGACTLPASVPGVGGAVLPDHGELWSQSARADVGARGVRCSWTCSALPAWFERTLLVEDDGAVALHYRATSERPIPFVWCAHPLFPLGPRTRLALPLGARMRVWSAHGLAVVPGEHRWPLLSTARGALDLSEPGAIDGAWAVKVFLDVEAGAASLVQPGGAHDRGAPVDIDDGIAGAQTLAFAWDALEVPHVGVWINHGGWTPFADGRAYSNVAIEPGIGAPDALDAALAEPWRGAHWLDGTRAWSLRLRAT